MEAVEEWLMPSLCRGMGWYDPPCLLQNDVFDVSLFLRLLSQRSKP